MTDAQHLAIVFNRIQTDRRVCCCAVRDDGHAAMIHVKGRSVVNVRGPIQSVAAQLCAALGEDA